MTTKKDAEHLKQHEKKDEGKHPKSEAGAGKSEERDDTQAGSGQRGGHRRRHQDEAPMRRRG